MWKCLTHPQEYTFRNILYLFGLSGNIMLREHNWDNIMIMSANKTKYAPQTKHKIKIYQSFSLHFSRVNIIGEFPTADKVP